MNIFYKYGYIGLRNNSVASHMAIQLVCWKCMFGSLPMGWNRSCNLSWTKKVPMFICYLLYRIILLFSLVVTFSALILQGRENCTWWWLGFVTSSIWNLFCYFCCCTLHITCFFLCVDTLFYIVTNNMYFLWLLFLVLLAKVGSQ